MQGLPGRGGRGLLGQVDLHLNLGPGNHIYIYIFQLSRAVWAQSLQWQDIYRQDSGDPPPDLVSRRGGQYWGVSSPSFYITSLGIQNPVGDSPNPSGSTRHKFWDSWAPPNSFEIQIITEIKAFSGV